MKKRLFRRLCLLALLVALPAAARGEVRFPGYASFSGGEALITAQSENEQTASLQCLTDGETAAAYGEALWDYGLILIGRWTLPAKEGYLSGTITAYKYPGQDAPAPFPMTVEQDEIKCHLLLQAFALEDGNTLLAITWSQGLTPFEWAAPTPCATPDPDAEPADIEAEINRLLHGSDGEYQEVEKVIEYPCTYCRQTGTCPDCKGTGTRYNPYTGQPISCPVDCPICQGKGMLESTVKEYVWVPKE